MFGGLKACGEVSLAAKKNFHATDRGKGEGNQ